MRRLLFILALGCAIPSAAREALHDHARLRRDAEVFLLAQVDAAYPQYRAATEIGAIDPRLRLADCPAPAHFLPAASRLWGSGSLGIRCDSPQPWSLYVSYRIRLKGPALIARNALQTGRPLTASDVETREVDFSSDPATYLHAPGELREAQLRRDVAAGTPITLALLRYPPVIRPGQRVRIIAAGGGFEVTQEGVAQNPAGIGDLVRVKAASGRTIQGTAQRDGTVRVNP